MKRNYFLFNDGVFKLKEVSMISNPKISVYYRLKLDLLDSIPEDTESLILENMAIDNACALNDLMVFEINSVEEASEYLKALGIQNAVLYGLIPVN